MQNSTGVLPTEGLLSRKRVLQLTGLGNATLWRYEAAGRFPRRFNLGSRRVAYRAKDIAAYIENPEGWIAAHGAVTD
jgi:prophage regulatory protein